MAEFARRASCGPRRTVLEPSCPRNSRTLKTASHGARTSPQRIAGILKASKPDMVPRFFACHAKSSIYFFSVKAIDWNSCSVQILCTEHVEALGFLLFLNI